MLATESGPGAAFIRWYTWSPWSHCAFVLPTGELLAARLKGGVQIRPHNHVNWTRTLTLTAPDAPHDVYEIAREQVGKPYSLATIAGLAIRHDFTSDHDFDCSKLLAWSFDQASYPILRTEHAGRITPRDVSLSPRLYY